MSNPVDYLAPIKLHVKGVIDQEIVVPITDQICTLQQYIHNDDYRVVYNGMVLNTSLSFMFYEIANDDTIYVIHNCEISRKAKRKIRADSASINMKIANMMKQKCAILFNDEKSPNDNISLESSRLLDLSFNKIAYRPSSYRRVCRVIKQKFENLDKNDEPQITILPEKALTPCTDFLPLLNSNSDSHAN